LTEQIQMFKQRLHFVLTIYFLNNLFEQNRFHLSSTLDNYLTAIQCGQGFCTILTWFDSWNFFPTFQDTPKNSIHFSSGPKWLKNNHIASLTSLNQRFSTYGSWRISNGSWAWLLWRFFVESRVKLALRKVHKWWRSSFAGRGNFFLQQTGLGVIWVEKRWSKSLIHSVQFLRLRKWWGKRSSFDRLMGEIQREKKAKKNVWNG